MKKITSLTPDQEAQMSVYRDKWIKIGLNTDRVDPERARAAVELLYARGGLSAPDKIVFANGPRHAKELLGKNHSVTDSCVYGNHEAAWLSFYDYMQNVCGIDFEGKLDGLMAVANECGWVSCYDTMAVVQDRPLHIKMDEDNRLHCETGPAILYADGFTVYSWHGVRIPREWIEDRASLTAKTALTWENVEQRRAACEILGWVNIIKELDAKVIDEDEDPMIGTLLEADIPEIGREKFLRVLCGTGREFALPVPPDMKTALQANAWTFGIDDPNELLNLEVRT